MSIRISEKFTFTGLIKFSLPAIFMILLTSLYTAVDGVFISRFVGSDALSAVNIILPIDGIMCGIAIMFGTGGSAIIGKKLGEGNIKEAKENFSLITVAAAVFGFILTVFLMVFMESVLRFLGASNRLLPYCMDYGRILFLFAIPYILQVMFNLLFVTAGKSKLALIVTVISGVMNLVLDYLFIVPLNMGIAGAAWGTAISRLFGGLFPVFYFIFYRSGLCFNRSKLDWAVIGAAMFNGSSEMVSNLATSVTTFLFNITMMELLGEEGVAAMTIVLYTVFIYTAVYLGFANSAAPIISYNYGSKDIPYLKKIFCYCLIFISVSSAVMLLITFLTAKTMIVMFVEYGTFVYDLAYHGYQIFAWNFLFAGINIFSSALFSAFSNGKVSATISFLRTLVFIVGALLILPKLFGVDGLWLAVPAAEFLTFIIVIPLLIVYGKKRYHYR